jgi:hypothetical protein
MTYPRLQTVDPQTPGFFHCVSRCVRRAFLCGQDVYSGRSYEHRKAWVEERLLALAECFAVGLYAYAVMSNHVHVVLHVDPQEAYAWSDEEVAERWVRLFPVRVEEVGRYWRAVGSVESLMAKARLLGQRWLKGAGGRRRRAYGRVARNY